MELGQVHHDAVQMTGLRGKLSLNPCAVAIRIFVAFLPLPNAHQSLHTDISDKKARIRISRESNASRRWDRQIRSFQRSSGMKNASTSRNSCKLFRFIRATVKNGLDVSGMICKPDGLLVNNGQRHVVHEMERLRARFRGIRLHFSWSVATDLLAEAQIPWSVQDLSWCQGTTPFLQPYSKSVERNLLEEFSIASRVLASVIFSFIVKH